MADRAPLSYVIYIAAPPEKDLEWNEKGVEGCFRFLEKVWRLLMHQADTLSGAPLPGPSDGADDPSYLHHATRLDPIGVKPRGA